MNSGRLLTIGFILCIGLISWGAHAFKQGQVLSKSDPRVHQRLLTLAQFSRQQSVQDLERSLTKIDELANQLKKIKGYEFAFELAHVHRIKAKWMLAQSKLSRDEPSEKLKERVLKEIESGESALQAWKQYWEGLTANEILDRLKSKFMEDSTIAQNPQLMIIVGGRADSIIQAMKDYDILKIEFENLKTLK